MQLITALRYSQPICLSFVGAGGKTTAIFKAAREILATAHVDEPPKTVLVTTATHFGAWQSAQADHLYNIKSSADIDKIEKKFPNGIVLFAGEENNNRLGGLPIRLLDRLHFVSEKHKLPLLIEADGAHGRSLKAPAEHEPAIPDFSQVVIVTASVKAMGEPLTQESVHRPEKFAELSGLKLGSVITNDAVAKVLLHRDGGLKNIPPDARRVALLNQVDTDELQSHARVISSKLISGYHSVILASLSNAGIESAVNGEPIPEPGKEVYAVVEPIAGIILAAGSSNRFGRPKQLLLWKGETLIRHVAITALNAGLSPVIVVLGSSSTEIESTINDLPLRIVNNLSWSEGISSSIKTGISSLPKEVGGAVLIQADQPHIPTLLIQSLVEAHQTTLNPIVAPQIDGRRGNPVLFDSCTFPELLSLQGDIGGRTLFGKFPVQWVTWNDSHLLLDIDSPEDFQKFLDNYPEDEEKV